jgi:hypothetical protein
MTAIGAEAAIHIREASQAISTTHQPPTSYRLFISGQNDHIITLQLVLEGHFMNLCVTTRHTFEEKIIINLENKEQSSNLLLALARTVILGFGTRWDPCPYFCSIQKYLRALKWGLFFDCRLPPAVVLE